MINTYVITCYHEGDIKNVMKQIENGKAHFCAAIKVPFWNINHEIIGSQYAIIYQNEKELDICVQC